jgi:dihydroorotase
MNKKNGYIIKNGRIIDPARNIDKKGDIAFLDGKIVKPSTLENPEIIDAEGLVVAPGFIDIHVHLRQPGATHKETIATGTRAAAAGGFTAVVPMPNTSPAIDNVGAIEYMKRHVAKDGVVKVLLCAAMTKDLEGKNMAGIGSLKQNGVVALSDDGHCVQNHEIMRHIMEYSNSFDLPIFDHCEDENLAADGVMHEGYWSTVLGLRGIPAASEELMVERDIIMSEITGAKIHIQHISAAGSVRKVREGQSRGIAVSAEVTPHHIALTDENLKHFDPNFKMNPPLMSEEHRQALIEGLKDGTIAAIATDHAPHTETEKLVEIDYAPFGIIGLETALSVCLTELYHKKHLTLPQLVSKFTAGPASILNMDTGHLKEGSAADITIFDPDCSRTIDSSKFYSKARNTPFNGCELRGEVKATVVDGTFVFSALPDVKGKI